MTLPSDPAVIRLAPLLRDPGEPDAVTPPGPLWRPPPEHPPCDTCGGTGLVLVADPVLGDYLDTPCTCPVGRLWRAV